MQFNRNTTTIGPNDLSGTLCIHKNDFKLYNVNIKNTVGPGVQAIAISQYISCVGLYASRFYHLWVLRYSFGKPWHVGVLEGIY
ncbi:hypothetical protein BDQ17DRAFT_1248025 [Cyathus striatus]|nr:hypothetical protein BDQ17DRAFT_1248025 [Cyathus striatus]